MGPVKDRLFKFCPTLPAELKGSKEGMPLYHASVLLYMTYNACIIDIHRSASHMFSRYLLQITGADPLFCSPAHTTALKFCASELHAPIGSVLRQSLAEPFERTVQGALSCTRFGSQIAGHVCLLLLHLYS